MPVPLPSLDSLRYTTAQFADATNKALADAGGTLASVGGAMAHMGESIVSAAKPVLSSIPGLKGSSRSSGPLLPPPPPPSILSQVIHWTRRNPGKAVLGAAILGVTIVGGSLAARVHRRQLKKLRIIKGTDNSKREIIVITNVATVEGAALAQDMEMQGFIVFVVVGNQMEADKVLGWGRADIHPVVVSDLSDLNDVQRLFSRVSAFMDDHNSDLLGDPMGTGSSFSSPVALTSSSFIMVEDETLSPPLALNSNAHTASLKQEQDTAHLKKAESLSISEPQYRLSAVIINPQEAMRDSIANLDVEAWRRCLDVNVVGAIQVSQQFLPMLKRSLPPHHPSRSPRLIFITSVITGSMGLPHQSALCASHHAISSIADSLRREVQYDGINIVCLKPGILGNPRTGDRHFFKLCRDAKGSIQAAVDIGCSV
ncbi:hypothetical protein EDD11_008888 [Mortierella claussenii]|nr:hypothetical protein EDD11_008888 [Mortierella claussenii]